MFIRMEAVRSVSEMVDYSISQTTLDDHLHPLRQPAMRGE
jgi:hypothetical protein